ncbi:L-histidine N(alpha)-methyltransferase [Streptomyces sp. NPDC090798]|uniref:L-histidine N(alpha)-methyltransferase n=1 Tax=Streptomyces sp. NPDC090798 TaxID=3365968 RepID=UPI003830D2F6
MCRNAAARPFRPTAEILAPDLTVDFASAEEPRTEISAQFRQDGVRAEPAAAGFVLRRRWNDSGGRFTLSLTFPAT